MTKKVKEYIRSLEAYLDAEEPKGTESNSKGAVGALESPHTQYGKNGRGTKSRDAQR
jgi:hypothetical protein